jgi:hypothetical protein
MTATITDPRPAEQARPVDDTLRVTQLRVIKSEWIKLRSLRSTVITLSAAALILVLLGLVFAAVQSGQITRPDGGPGADVGLDPTAISLSGVMLAQLIVGTLGVMVTAGEYTTGMIRSSLAAVPRRLPVLWAKAIVLAAVTFVLMLVAAFVAFFVGQAVLSAGDAASASLSDTGVLRAIIGAAVQLTGVGLLGLALGPCCGAPQVPLPACSVSPSCCPGSRNCCRTAGRPTSRPTCRRTPSRRS